MKTLIAIVVLIPLLSRGQEQFPKGQIIVHRLTSESLKNKGGENPTRRVTVYLPPGYNSTTNRYPTIYYLHGGNWNDSLMIADDHFDRVMDKAIATGKIRPVIVVLPDHYTLYRGSWYTNSTLTGDWVDFTAQDVVKFIDNQYRTIEGRDGRGITGHSMGGYGALKIGMQFSNVFSSIYALSPGFLGFFGVAGPSSDGYRLAQKIKTRGELSLPENGLANGVVAMGRAFSPNLNKPPFYADLPYTYDGNKLIVDYKVLELWNKNSPMEMMNDFTDNLKSLKALKLDWGRNDEYTGIPLTCLMFSQKLENMGINHQAEEYVGRHADKLWTDDGRALNDMLPFFDSYLAFDEIKYKAQESKTKK